MKHLLQKMLDVYVVVGLGNKESEKVGF